MIQIDSVQMFFPIRKGLLRKTVGHIKAVDGISLEIYKGETLGLVGESGCGKTTLGRCVVGLYSPTSGKVRYGKLDVHEELEKGRDSWRQDIQMIFQDPFGSLNPRKRVGSIVAEPLLLHHLVERSRVEEKVREILDWVGLGSGDLEKYPHEFSGGQRQRIGIARALAVRPKFIVADEPVSALDVSIQAQIINLLLDLKDRFSMSYLFISHDLRVVEYIADRVAVMYLGKLMELLPAKDLKNQILHPYSKALLDAVPQPHLIGVTPTPLTGDVPTPSNPPEGCVFHPRCPLAEARCRKEIPTFRQVGDKHEVACHIV